MPFCLPLYSVTPIPGSSLPLICNDQTVWSERWVHVRHFSTVFFIYEGENGFLWGKREINVFLYSCYAYTFFAHGKKKKKGPNSLKNSKYQRREDKVSYPILQIRIWNTCRYFFFLKKSSQIPNRIGSFCVWGSPLLKPCAHITGLNRGTVATQQKQHFGPPEWLLVCSETGLEQQLRNCWNLSSYIPDSSLTLMLELVNSSPPSPSYPAVVQ